MYLFLYSKWSGTLLQGTPRTRRYSNKEMQEMVAAMKGMIENHEKTTTEQARVLAEQGQVMANLGKDVKANSENIRNLTILLSNLLVAPPVMVAPPPVPQMVAPPGRV